MSCVPSLSPCCVQNESFWCCYGTALESFSKLGDSIYFHDGGGGGGTIDADCNSAAAATASVTQQLWVVQFVSSTLRDEMHGLFLTQTVSNVRASSGRRNNILQAEIKLARLSSAREITADLTISLRIPGWADADATTVSLNGQPLVRAGTAQVGSFLHVKRPQWQPGGWASPPPPC
eukprot:COSAG01_NODE_10866_length_2066_cov_1.188612_2_plen_177_part_00